MDKFEEAVALLNDAISGIRDRIERLKSIENKLSKDQEELEQRKKDFALDLVALDMKKKNAQRIEEKANQTLKESELKIKKLEEIIDSLKVEKLRLQKYRRSLNIEAGEINKKKIILESKERELKKREAILKDRDDTLRATLGM